MRIGPVDSDRFQRLYPGEELWDRLSSVLARSLHPAIEYQVVVILDEGAAAESTVLGDGKGRLGRDTWLARTAWRGPRSALPADDCSFGDHPAEERGQEERTRSGLPGRGSLGGNE